MMWIKLNRDCALGKKGDTIQCIEHVAKQRILDKQAVEVSNPHTKVIKASRIKNKALSAG
jgi:hypothetical protein